MEAKKDNVIHFPGRKPEAPSAPEAPQSRDPKPRWNSTVKGMALIAAVVTFSSFANRWTGSSQTDLASSGRSLASVAGDRSIEPSERDSNWERSLAKDLASRDRRELASLRVGRNPSLEDKLRFSYLSQGYSVSMKDGKLSEIYWPANQPKDGLVFLGSGSDFLYQNRELMPVNFRSAIAAGVSVSGEGQFEKFHLIGDDNQKVAEVVYGLDKFGHLLALKVSTETIGQ